MITQRNRGNRWRREIRRSRRGSEILEAALVFPILLALAFGTVEFGYYFYVEHNLESAAREGARAGIVDGTNEDINNAVNEVMKHSGYAVGDYDPPEIGLSGDQNEYLTVKVKMHWSNVSEGLKPMHMIQPQNDVVVGTATMRIEK